MNNQFYTKDKFLNSLRTIIDFLIFCEQSVNKHLKEHVQPIIYLFEPPPDWNFLEQRYNCENSWLTKNYHAQPINKRCGQNIHLDGLEKQKGLNQFITTNVSISKYWIAYPWQDYSWQTKKFVQMMIEKFAINQNKKLSSKMNGCANNSFL